MKVKDKAVKNNDDAYVEIETSNCDNDKCFDFM